MSGTYDHPNTVTFKSRLRKILLGKEADLLSFKASCADESFETYIADNGTSGAAEEFSSSELAKELYLTAVCFKDLDIGDGTLSDVYDDTDENILTNENAPSDFIEEESLRYIGGYIARKFSVKYPHLGHKGKQNAPLKTWIDCKNRGGLFFPSDSFFAKLEKMRNVFKTIHGSSLREGKNCVKRIVTDLQSVTDDLPEEVVHTFAKLSVYFQIRYLNKNIKMNRRKTKTCRNEDNKRKKLN